MDRGNAKNSWWSNVRRRTLPMIFQVETTECALAALAMISGYYGRQYSISELRESYPSSLRGLSLGDVARISDSIGLSLRGIRCDLAGIRKLRTPALLHWDIEHFVVLRKATRRHITIHDPARGICQLRLSEASCHFTGVAAELMPTPQFRLKKPQSCLTLPSLLRSVSGIGFALGKIAYLTLLVELLALLLPVATKFAVDAGVGGADLRLMEILALGMIVSVGFQVFTMVLRDFSISYAGALVNSQLAGTVLQHLMRLPMSFFEKRQIGDLVDRYRSVAEIRSMVVGNMPLVLLDGLFSLISLCIVFAFSPSLAGLSLAALLGYLSIKLLFHSRIRGKVEQTIHARGREQGYVVETLRCFLTVKAGAREVDRNALWQQRHVALLNAEREFSDLMALLNSGSLLITGLDISVSLYVGCRSVILGDLSIGGLLAILMYKSVFSVRASQLANRIVDIRMLDAHLHRISDIVQSAKEEDAALTLQKCERPKLAGGLEVRDIHFAYGAFLPRVLNGVSLSLPRGRFIAIVGQSGCGKTTILKLILGLYKATSGEIYFDGIPAGRIPMQCYRSQIGVVMQDDTLLTGTLLENIAFFDTIIDEKRAVHCAKLACIHDDIQSTTMRYNTRVGDMGIALSAGQRQRVMLARALYRDPAILILDEGTANLDRETEAQVIHNLRQTKCSIIFMTHSPYVARHADSVLRLNKGFLEPLLIPISISESGRLFSAESHERFWGQ